MAVVHPLEPPAASAEMHAWQDACAALVRLEPGDTGAELVAAADVAYALDESLACAAVVVLERGSLREVERRTWTGPSLRRGPAAALMLALATEYRIPEPLRQAHHASMTLRGAPRPADEPRADDNHSPS